jgi:hypothetical protein
LSRILIAAGRIIDEQQTVVGGIGHERSLRRPGEFTRVCDPLGNWVEWHNVVAGSAKKDQSHSTGGRGVPGNIESLANRNQLVQSWSKDWVA